MKGWIQYIEGFTSTTNVNALNTLASVTANNV